MNPKNKLKGNLMTDVYFNISVAVIWNDIDIHTSVDVTRNGFFEVLNPGRKVTLIFFDHDLSNKSILIGDSKVDMDLPNGNPIDHNKVTPLLEWSNNLLLYTAQYCDFIMVVNNVAKHHSGNKYIHDG